MNSEQLKNLILNGENENVEFKLNFGSKAIIATDAFANSKGGMVILGVSDVGEVKGINTNKESVQNWLNEIKQKTEPSIVPNVFEVTLETKKVIVLKIAEVPIKPIALQGRFYARKGNSNHILDVNEIVDLRMESMSQSFDAFSVKTTFEDLENKALYKFSEKTKEKGRFLPSKELKTDFVKLGLIQDNKLTRAAELLFGLHHTAIHIGSVSKKTAVF